MAKQAGDNHPAAWYWKMKEKSAFWASMGGWTLDAFDAQIFTFAVPAITAAFAVNEEKVGRIATATLLTSAFGGWLGGALSDRYGRVRTLQITILWFSVFTFLCGLAQQYTELLFFRAVMGFGFGGEWAVGAMLVGEVIDAKDRGKALGFIQSGWAIGWGIAALMSTLFYYVFSTEFWWRPLFWVGLAPALLVFFVRERFVQEPVVSADARKELAAAGKDPNFLEIFAPEMLKTTLLACLLTTGAQGGYYAITNWLPTYLQTERQLTVLKSAEYMAVTIIGSFLGYLVSAWLNDRIGRRPTFILFAAFSFVIVIAYTMISASDATILVLGLPMGFAISGIFSGMGPILSELFPHRMRGSGQGFAYNFGRGVGALTPWLVGLLSPVLHLGPAMGICALIAYGLVVVAALLLPETKGSDLPADAAPK
jgi:MFS family permease